MFKESIATTVNIIGSGVSALAAAIRLAKKGYVVKVFEKNAYAGGKLSELQLGEYRFDKGPSLLTLPNLIDELTELSGTSDKFEYERIKVITRYFFEDGTQIVAGESSSEFAKELKNKLGENEQSVIDHFKTSAFYYKATADLFLHQSIHRFRNLLSLKTLHGIWNAKKLNLFSSMNDENKKFKHPKTLQIFNRYATYNGSNPYKAPALLNMIPNLEFGFGAFIPKHGMHDITLHLYKTAIFCGVKFLFNCPIDKIELEEKSVKGLWSKGVFFAADVVLNCADMHLAYSRLLPKQYSPHKLLKQEKSSSAFVFFWGIKKEFKELGLHNILFSENYEAEFKALFETSVPYSDPTIYINITSKHCKKDAPLGCENWFVMVNVPHNAGSQAIQYREKLREQVIAKINRILKVNIEEYIEAEDKLDPFDIEQQTSSIGGSLYGNSSNSKFAAFLRHANFSSKLKGLYFAGGSVHPGGGIPLCLLSGKITADLIHKKHHA